LTELNPEDGCYGVAGETWGTFEDAATAAAPGATVHVCGGAFNDAVTITRDLTIVGSAEEMTRWSSPDGRPVIRISAAKVRIEDMALDASSVVIVNEGGSLELIRSTIRSDDRGIVGQEGSFYLEDSAIITTGTAMLLAGGDATVVRGSIGGSATPAVVASGATAELHELSIGGLTGEGPAFQVDQGGVLGLFDVHVAPAVEVARIDGGALTARGLWATGQRGITAIGGEIALEMVRLDTSETGVHLDGTTRAALTDVTLAGDGSSGSWGLIATDADLSWTGGGASGHGGGGVAISSRRRDDVVARLDGVTLDDNPEIGLRARGVTLTADGLVVTGALGDSRRCTSPAGDQRSCGFGVEATDADLHLTGGRVAGSAVGVLATGGEVALSGVTLDANGTAVWTRFGAFSADAATFSHTEGSAVLIETSTWTITDSTFDGNRADRVANDVGQPIRVSGASIGVEAWAAVGELLNCSFVDGDRAISLTGGEAVLRDVTITAGRGVAVSLADGAATWIDGLDISGNAGTSFDCEASNLIGADLSVDGTAWGARETSAWADGAWGAPTTVSAPEPVARAEACFLDLQGLTLSGAPADGVVLTRGIADLTGVDLSDVAGHGVVATDARLTVTDLGWTAGGGTAFYLSGGAASLSGIPDDALTCDVPPELTCDACACPVPMDVQEP
jgi:hypothetical protein